MSDLEFSVGADTSDFDRGLSSAAASASRYSGEIVNRTADKLVGLRDVSNVLASALGFNIEKIADRVARFVTGMSEEEEASLKKVADMGEETARIYEKLAALHRTDAQSLELAEQQQARLLHERDGILSSIAEREAKIKAARADEALSMFQLSQIEKDNAITAGEKNRLAEIGRDLAEKQLAIAQFQDAMDKKSADARLAEIKQIDEANKTAAENESKANFDQLTSSEKIAELKQREIKLQAQINDEATSEVDAALLRVKWADAHAQLLALISDRQKKIAGSTAEELEYLQLQRKVTQGLADGPEHDRYVQLTLQRKERETMIELENLEAKSIQGTLTPADKDRLDVLSKQKDKIDQQVAALSHVATGTKTVTVVTEKQKDAVDSLVDSYDKVVEAASKGWSSAGSGSPLGMHNLGNVSTDVLTAELEQLTRRYKDLVSSFVPVGPNVVAGSTGENLNYYLASEIQSIRDELAFRQDFTAAYSRGGRSGALQQFVSEGRDAASFDTAIANMNAWQQGLTATQQSIEKTNTALANIQSMMVKSKLFPSM